MKVFRSIMILSCFVFLGGMNSSAEMTSDEAFSEFVAAGIAYKEGRYDAAISRYNKILNENWVNGPLYYNLGNSYFKKKDVGRAVLNYERARKFIPRDSDLNFNNHYVRSKIDRKVVDVGQNFFYRAFLRHIQFYTIDEMVMILFCVAFLIGIVFLISSYVQWSPSIIGGIIMMLMISFLVYGGSLIVKVQVERGSAIIMLKTDTFFEPRTDSTVHFTLLEGMRARILKTEENWVKIKRLDGKAGWVDREVLEEI